MNDSDFWKALSHYKNYKYSKWSNELNDNWLNISPTTQCATLACLGA